jgi:FixJ family two-component response regulator
VSCDFHLDRGSLLKGLRHVIGVIDDDASVRGALRRLFRTVALDVSLFESAEAYLASPDRAALDCLVVDVCLPGLSGLELLERLQAEGPQRAVVITSHDDVRARHRAEQAGAAAFFLKPFDNRELSEAVLRAVGVASHRD